MNLRQELSRSASHGSAVSFWTRWRIAGSAVVPTEPVPFRVKDLRRACLKALSERTISGEQRRALRRDLNSLFVAIQLFSYPGDYIRESPTVERLAEILTKFEQDALGVTYPAPRGHRRAIICLGEPIDLRNYLQPGGSDPATPPRV